MILSLFGKAVPARQVAVMRDVEAQGLDHSGPRRKGFDRRLIRLLGKEASLFLQRPEFFQHFVDFFRSRCYIPRIRTGRGAEPVQKLLPHLFLIPGLRHQCSRFVHELVGHMHGSARHVQYHIVAVVLI